MRGCKKHVGRTAAQFPSQPQMCPQTRKGDDAMLDVVIFGEHARRHGAMEIESHAMAAAHGKRQQMANQKVRIRFRACPLRRNRPTGIYAD